MYASIKFFISLSSSSFTKPVGDEPVYNLHFPGPEAQLEVSKLPQLGNGRALSQDYSVMGLLSKVPSSLAPSTGDITSATGDLSSLGFLLRGRPSDSVSLRPYCDDTHNSYI